MLELVLTGKPPIELWVQRETTDLVTGEKQVTLALPKGFS